MALAKKKREFPAQREHSNKIETTPTRTTRSQTIYRALTSIASTPHQNDLFVVRSEWADFRWKHNFARENTSVLSIMSLTHWNLESTNNGLMKVTMSQ